MLDKNIGQDDVTIRASTPEILDSNGDNLTPEILSPPIILNKQVGQIPEKPDCTLSEDDLTDSDDSHMILGKLLQSEKSFSNSTVIESPTHPIVESSQEENDESLTDIDKLLMTVSDFENHTISLVETNTSTSIGEALSFPALLAGTPPILNGMLTPDKAINRTCGDSTPVFINHNPTHNMLKKVGYKEEDISSALAKLDGNAGENKYGRSRPATHVFSQGKLFTYPKLEVQELKNSGIKDRCAKSGKNGLSSPVLDPEANSFVPLNPNHHIFTSLRSVRIDNLKNVIIGQLNINSLRYKFQAITEIIINNIDILILTETKLDHTFPLNQFRIPGYRTPYRKDRDRDGGGVMIYVREDIPSDILRRHKLDENIEAIFIEVNLRTTKFLLIAAYNSPTPKYRIPDMEFFTQISQALDVYSGYDKFVLGGDLNINAFDENEALEDFLEALHAKNLVKDPTCYSNPANPSCLDLYITNSYRSFQGTTTFATGLSDCHKMVITVMKTIFPKADPRIITYRDYSKYCSEEFGRDLQRNLNLIEKGNYQPFDDVFMNTLQINHPLKNKTIRANQQSYVSKEMRKGIMTRSRLQHRYWKYGTKECKLELKKTSKLL